MTARHRLVRVPATSANLGPGYDAMAAAVSLFLELEVEETGEFSLDPGGLDVSTGRDNLVVRAFETLHPADGIAFRLRSEIPLARGLGSSAAAIVAGLLAHGLPTLDHGPLPERVVCVLTGHGLKDPDTAFAKAPSVINCDNDLSAVERVVFD